jgi:hypothetical protein
VLDALFLISGQPKEKCLEALEKFDNSDQAFEFLLAEKLKNL